ncbi:phosphoribosylanthranilate isomerase [Bacillus shackletonii]|nr:phosphoribosylanthranilate isomerase [Heyndrickxia shackletonii]NEZ01619.1 phosphoribosylanthranilate isomerase [Heyndrickxia shackletonii]
MGVKICGIKTMEAAKAAVDAGADFIGFVFAESKRRISPEQAKKMAAHIPSHVKKVGVFVNEDQSTIRKIVAQVGLDYIQLHGNESPQFAESLQYPIIKAFSCKNFTQINNYSCDYYLIDGPKAGSGETFDWTDLEILDLPKDKLILAGGLTVHNVKNAILTVHPAAVDVSSGVETNHEKDPEKIKSFVRNATLAYQQLKERKE